MTGQTLTKKSKKVSIDKILGKINKAQAEKVFIQYLIDKDLIKHTAYVGVHNMVINLFEETWSDTQKRVKKTGKILSHKDFMDILEGKRNDVFQE